MCPPGYHHNGIMAARELGHTMYMYIYIVHHFFPRQGVRVEELASSFSTFKTKYFTLKPYFALNSVLELALTLLYI